MGARGRPTRLSRLRMPASVCLVLLLSLPASGGAAEQVWAALQQPGHAALVRHTLAPGIGDPENFSLDDCASQRNLNTTGREQARMLGQRLRKHGLADHAVFSSHWCRAMETADLLGLGEPRALQALDSFFRDRTRREDTLAALRSFLQKYDDPRGPVLVTHQVNITGLTGKPSAPVKPWSSGSPTTARLPRSGGYHHREPVGPAPRGTLRREQAFRTAIYRDSVASDGHTGPALEQALIYSHVGVGVRMVPDSGGARPAR